MNSKREKPKRKPWDQFLEGLYKCDRARCVTQVKLRSTGNDLEIWIIGELVVIFQIYSAHGGFDVYTSHEAPKEIGKVLPWILTEGEKQLITPESRYPKA